MMKNKYLKKLKIIQANKDTWQCDPCDEACETCFN